VTATRPRIVATGRLVRLREKQVEDAERDYAWRRDPELAAYDAARPITMSFRSFVASMAEELHYPTPQRRTYAIEEVESGKHIGNVMYYGYDSATREAELGITIGDRDYWSQGYGTDAVRSMLHHLFDNLGLRRVFLHTLTWNHRAQSCFRRAGFRALRELHRGGYEFVYMEATPRDVRDEDE
jgi:RimJ/RimL family protein N-acetyltransferase